MPSNSLPSQKHLDRRVVERYLRRGVLTDKDFQAHLKSLPDLEGKAETIDVGDPGAQDDDASQDA